MSHKRNIFYLMLCFYISNCSSLKKRTFVVKQDAVLVTQDEQKKPIKANQPQEIIIDRPYYIEAPGHIGVLMYPIDESYDQITVNLPPADKWANEIALMQTNRLLNTVIQKIFTVHQLLAQKKIEQALQATNQLIAKYPDMSFLKFLQASCLTLLNQQDDALMALKQGLRDFPDNPLGLELYQQLTGKEYSH